MPCLHGTLAKLSGVVPNEYIHPRTSIQLPVKIDRMQQHEETRSLLRIGDQFIKDKRTTFSAVPSWKSCEAGWRCA